MYTEQEILNNPSLILFDESLPISLKGLALTKKPSLIDAISDKSIDLLKIAFENGYWNDNIKENIEKMEDENIAEFFVNTDNMYLESFFQARKTVLGEKSLKSLITSHPEYYGSSLVKKSEELDWIVLNSITAMTEDTVNPLLDMFDLNSKKVQFMYEKFGKLALKNLPMEFQTEEIKMDIIKKNSYDYPYIAFTNDIAKLYVTDYLGTLPYVMKQSKYDPYYETRVLNILSVYGAALQYVEKQNENMQLIAIKNNPMSIEYAIDPSEDVCLIAVQLDKDAAEVMEYKPKSVCKFLNIPYKKASKYSSKSKYLVSMSANGMNCYRVFDGSIIDDILNIECLDKNLKKVKNISKIKEITDEEINVLKKFNLFKTENPFFEENE